MMLLEAINLKYEIKDRLLFEVETLKINNKDRIGLVGRNGSGKTTLLELLANRRQPTEGTILTEATRELIPQLKRTDSVMSGGEVTQEYINLSLAKKAEILLADEPTTNLDTAHIEKLEKQLLKFPGALVIVSHDRAFLDTICTQIWEIEDGKMNEYKGNYTDYVTQKDIKRKQQENAYEQYIQKKKQLENALELKEQKAQRATKKPKKVSASEAKITGAKPYFAKKQKKLQKAKKAIETRLEKLDKVEKIRENPAIKMQLPNEEAFTGRTILRIEDIRGKVGQRTLWEPARFSIKGGDKVAIIGNNGVGKTTLIRKIVTEESGISISPSVKTGYFSQNLDVLEKTKSILENVRSTSNQDETLIRTVLARLHFYRDDVYKKVHILSGGERVKVAFAKLFVSDINTLILDEPTNYLDIGALEALEELLTDYKGTVLFVSHDRRFIETVATKIVSIENQEITFFAGSYQAFKKQEPKTAPNAKEEQLLLLETKISEVLSKLSIEPTEELDQEFQNLLRKKREIKNGRK
ncbi:Vga family ABC-F type ribosomal protection protein [Oceanobacillus bengalensis]|uniref:Vga family ABC-F type ribosomal protection protein n=1 Tax=Oceanobacillus bengalensis TaxID=1435466 RepID=A0A494YU34_9BACI|nr:Vga family ABC-F type ribosomal protection protein [Oceanobacillus bengalensis]RKQ13623.1 Vga family ABC-F type ribosomal protection protein [Oceanobacillus bengalensis]